MKKYRLFLYSRQQKREQNLLKDSHGQIRTNVIRSTRLLGKFVKYSFCIILIT
jgi:hypothetical protein